MVLVGDRLSHKTRWAVSNILRGQSIYRATFSQASGRLRRQGYYAEKIWSL